MLSLACHEVVMLYQIDALLSMYMLIPSWCECALILPLNSVAISQSHDILNLGVKVVLDIYSH